MITEEKMNTNKAEYLSLVRSIQRKGADMNALVKKLEMSDFFEAPASSMYHNAFKGGLCDHSLNVRDWLMKFVAVSYPEGSPWSEDTLNIVSLFHDLAKMDYYEPYFRNVKRYCNNGNKKDEIGRFEWVAEEAFKVRSASERFLYGSHGANSEYLTGTYIPLSLEESTAIVNHMGWEPTSNSDLTGIYNKNHLAVLLHLADMAATYISERIY